MHLLLVHCLLQDVSSVMTIETCGGMRGKQGNGVRPQVAWLHGFRPEFWTSRISQGGRAACAACFGQGFATCKKQRHCEEGGCCTRQ